MKWDHFLSQRMKWEFKGKLHSYPPSPYVLQENLYYRKITPIVTIFWPFCHFGLYNFNWLDFGHEFMILS